MPYQQFVIREPEHDPGYFMGLVKWCVDGLNQQRRHLGCMVPTLLMPLVLRYATAMSFDTQGPGNDQSACALEVGVVNTTACTQAFSAAVDLYHQEQFGCERVYGVLSRDQYLALCEQLGGVTGQCLNGFLAGTQAVEMSHNADCQTADRPWSGVFTTSFLIWASVLLLPWLSYTYDYVSRVRGGALERLTFIGGRLAPRPLTPCFSDAPPEKRTFQAMALLATLLCQYASLVSMLSLDEASFRADGDNWACQWQKDPGFRDICETGYVRGFNLVDDGSISGAFPHNLTACEDYYPEGPKHTKWCLRGLISGITSARVAQDAYQQSEAAMGGLVLTTLLKTTGLWCGAALLFVIHHCAVNRRSAVVDEGSSGYSAGTSASALGGVSVVMGDL